MDTMRYANLLRTDCNQLFMTSKLSISVQERGISLTGGQGLHSFASLLHLLDGGGRWPTLQR